MPDPISVTRLRRGSIVLSAIAVLALGAATAAAQGNMGFLKDTPLAYFKGDDAKLMRAAAAEVLKSAKDGTRKDWENPATGNRGAITLLTQFPAADGRPCAQVRVESRAGGMENASTMSVCKSADGIWKLASVKPPQT